MESSQKVNYQDPGWNDPPTFSYDKAAAVQASSSKKGISLNKRVAFPMSGPVAQGKNVIDPTAPPADFDVSKVGAPPLGPPKPQSPPVASSPPKVKSPIVNSESELSSNDRLLKVLSNLRTISTIEGDGEIGKRIQVMRNMWLDGKLDLPVQIKLYELSEALNLGDIDKADHIQKGLMVDHVAQCSSWMSGIRHLINHKRNGESSAV